MLPGSYLCCCAFRRLLAASRHTLGVDVQDELGGLRARADKELSKAKKQEPARVHGGGGAE